LDKCINHIYNEILLIIFTIKNWYIFSDLAETRKNEEIVELVFNECKKENVNYRMVALKTLGELLEKLKIDRFAQTYQLVMHIIQKVWFFLILICHYNKNSDL